MTKKEKPLIDFDSLEGVDNGPKLQDLSEQDMLRIIRDPESMASMSISDRILFFRSLLSTMLKSREFNEKVKDAVLERGNDTNNQM